MDYTKPSKISLGILLIILSGFLSRFTYNGPKNIAEVGFYLIPITTTLMGLHMFATIEGTTRFSKGLRFLFSFCAVVSLLSIFLFVNY